MRQMIFCRKGFLRMVMLSVLTTNLNVSAQTASDFQTNYPKSAKAILEGLDWTNQNLKGVRKANDAETLEALVNYYVHNSEKIQKKKNPVKPYNAKGSDIVIELLEISNKKKGGYINFSVQPKGLKPDITRFGYYREFSRSFHSTNNEKYHTALKRVLNDLVVGQPPVYLPTSAERWGELCWISLNAALRMSSIEETMLSYIQHPKMESELFLLMLSSLFEHAEFIKSYGSSHAGNWMTTESDRLMKIAVLFPEHKNSSEWMEVATHRFLSNFRNSFLDDGAQCELSVHYGYIAFESAMSFYQLMQEAEIEIPEYYLKSLKKQINFYAWNCNPDGMFMPSGDSDAENPGLNWPTKNSGEQFITELDQSEAMYLYTKGEKGVQPSEPPSRVFNRSGYAISRDTYGKDNNQFSFFDMGIYGTGHVHHDAMHLSVYNKRRILVDPGRYHYFLYDGWTEGYFKAARGHNTVSINGCDQFYPHWKVHEETIQEHYNSRAKKPINATHYKLTKDFDFFRGITPNGYIEEDKNGQGFGKRLDGKNFHERGLYYKRGEYWVVVDRLFTDKQREFTSFWHFHPDVNEISIDENGVLLTSDPGKGNLMIVAVKGNVLPTVKLFKGSEEPKQGWYAPKYGKKVESWAAEYYSSGQSLTWMAWIIIPYDDIVPVIDKVQMVGLNNHKYNLVFNINGKSEDIDIQMGDTPEYEEDPYCEGLLPEYVLKRNN